MSHADIERQMVDARARWPEASHAILPNKTVLVTVPGLPLSAGWNRPTAKVFFLLSSEFPVAQPDIYYLEEGVLPLGGVIKVNHQRQQIEGTDITATWVSWHASAWNPNQDTILSWVATIIGSFARMA